MKFKEDKFRIFWKIGGFFVQNQKKSDFKLKKIEFEVPKFQIWNRIFFWFCKNKRQCSKIFEIYLSRTSSEPIFSKIIGTFLSSQSLTHSLLAFFFFLSSFFLSFFLFSVLFFFSFFLSFDLGSFYREFPYKFFYKEIPCKF